jgi:hypothetical protein
MPITCRLRRVCVGVTAGVSPSVSAFASCRACSSRSSTSSPRSSSMAPSLTICLRRTRCSISAIWKQRHWPCRATRRQTWRIRCDFPGGNAGTLYQSIRRLLDLPPDTRLYMCHDYPPGGREAVCHTTVAEQRRANIHVRDGVTEAEFVQMRTKRDATLGMPTLMLPAIQVNIRAGMLPPAEPNGVQYLKIPLNAL